MNFMFPLLMTAIILVFISMPIFEVLCVFLYVSTLVNTLNPIAHLIYIKYFLPLVPVANSIRFTSSIAWKRDDNLKTIDGNYLTLEKSFRIFEVKKLFIIDLMTVLATFEYWHYYYGDIYVIFISNNSWCFA